MAGLASQLGEKGALGATVALPEGMSGVQLAEIVSEAIQEAVTLEAAQVALALKRSQLRCEVGPGRGVALRVDRRWSEQVIDGLVCQEACVGFV